jgi:phage terminase large subunit-like protein
MQTNTSRGASVAAWIEQFLVHAEGDFFGRPFRLARFERDFLESLYRTDSAGRRVVRRALLGLPKGNGKTELAAAIAIAELAGPFAAVSPLVIVAAAAFEQADLVFGAARTMIANGPLEPYFEAYDTEILRRDGRPGVMRRIAAAAGTNDGARPTAVIADEVHEWTGARERVHLVISNGLSKRRDGLELNISTAGASADSLLGRLFSYGQQVASGEVIDPGFLFAWRSAGEHWDLGDPDQLRAALTEANPAIEAGFLDLERLVARFAEIPRFEFERYHLNRWVEADEAWIAASAWAACFDPGRNVPDGTEIVIGFDGSATRDNTALIGCTVEDKPHLFLIGLWQRDERDPAWQVPRVEVDARLADAVSRFEVRRVACDPAGWYGEIQDWLARFGESIVIVVPQVNERMAPAADAFRAAVLAGELTHDGSPALARAVANARTRETRWGIGIRKDHPGSPRKIDAAVAALLAFQAVGSATPVPVHEPNFAWA